MITTDVVIIGAGHNGLVCAAYLLQRGLGVTLLEKREVPGGRPPQKLSCRSYPPVSI
ncbi:FAD-dependent oxidoreductase [Synechocystis sp. B12]|nr:FAD-dependent oxidoreductase [Synechocystis sp. B12]